MNLDELQQLEKDAKRQIELHVQQIRRERVSTIRWLILFFALGVSIVAAIVGFHIKGVM